MSTNERLLVFLLACAAVLPGQGLFAPPQQAPTLTGTCLYHPVIGDFDNDLLPDVVLTEWITSLAFFGGQGDGTFLPAVVSSFLPVVPQEWATPLGAGLVDGDQNLDAVTWGGDYLVDWSTTPVAPPGIGIRYHLGQGNGAFVTQPAIPLPYVISSRRSVIRNIDGTGPLELITASVNPVGGFPVVDVFSLDTNPPGVTLLYRRNLPFTALGIAVSDFTGDGLDDISVLMPTASNQPQVDLVVQGPALAFAVPGAPVVLPWNLAASCPAPFSAANCFECVAGDFDADGLDDLAVVTFYATTAMVAVLPSVSGAGPASIASIQTFNGISPGFLDLFAEDLDRDGFDDVVFNDQLFRVAPAALGGGVLPLPPLPPPPLQAFSYATFHRGLVDLDLDGDLDLVQSACAPTFIPEPGGGGLIQLNDLYSWSNDTIRPGACGTISGPPPTISVGTPAPGNPSFAIGLAGVLPGSATILGIALVPVPLAPGGCGIALAPSSLLHPTTGTPPLFADASGQLSLTFPLPLGVAGAEVFAQWLAVDPQGTYTAFGTPFVLTDSRNVVLW